MRRVEWKDKVLIDALRSNGDIFGYLGGAIQLADDFGTDWRRLTAASLLVPPINSTVYDPTTVEPEKFHTTIKGWDDLKRELKKARKEREFYRFMSSVVHLDLYALSRAHYAVFRLSSERTYGTTEEFVDFVLKQYKRPTFILYDDDDTLEHFSDWILQRGLEARYEYYVCFKIFPNRKSIVKFIREHKEDIKFWDENYKRSMNTIRVFRAFARRYWRRKKGLDGLVATHITAELKAIYSIVSEVKTHLQECESILAGQKATLVEERIAKLQEYLQQHSPRKPSRKKTS